jgi:hypothetical protein
VVVVTGDHGEGLGEHGITEHGFDLYPAQTKVPFIIRVPGLPPQRSRVPVGHVDLAPTIVNLTGQNPAGAGGGTEQTVEKGFLGQSLVGILGGAPAPEAGAVFQEVTSERGKKRALVTATHHLLWNWTPDDTTECYDRTRDPGETHDLWGRAGGDQASAAECRRLKAELQTMVSALSLPPGYAEKVAFGIIPPGAPDPQPAIRLDARLGDQIGIAGADVTPAEVARGGEVTVVTYFQVRKRLPPSWRLFFHLDGPGGFRNLDHVPVEGLLPTEQWRPGQRIRDRQRIAVAPYMPAGRYTLWIGVYRSGSSDRLPVSPRELTDGHDRLRVGTFVVR